MTDHTSDRILYALFSLSRDTRQIDATELARSVGVTATQAAQALVALEAVGLVDATRARLTMLGLARAVALQASGSGGPQIDLAHAKPRTKPADAAPLAAQVETVATVQDAETTGPKAAGVPDSSAPCAPHER